MRRFGPAVALAVAALTARAEPPAPVYMTGERLLGLLAIPPESVGNLTPAQENDLDRAYRYMDGVHDATTGKEWCDNQPHFPKPDVIYSEAGKGLKTLPPAALKRNAAHLLVEIWRRRWPCKGTT